MILQELEPKNIETLSFETLTNIHKLEGQEALAYLTILFAVIIGIIGFLGSAPRLAKISRVLILLFYIGMHFAMVIPFIQSMKMHSAIHKEIAIYVQKHPDLFLLKPEGSLFDELSNLGGHNIGRMEFGGYVLLFFMSLCILSLGSNRIISLEWTGRILKK